MLQDFLKSFRRILSSEGSATSSVALRRACVSILHSWLSLPLHFHAVTLLQLPLPRLDADPLASAVDADADANANQLDARPEVWGPFSNLKRDIHRLLAQSVRHERDPHVKSMSLWRFALLPYLSLPVRTTLLTVERCIFLRVALRCSLCVLCIEELSAPGGAGHCDAAPDARLVRDCVDLVLGCCSSATFASGAVGLVTVVPRTSCPAVIAQSFCVLLPYLSRFVMLCCLRAACRMTLSCSTRLLKFCGPG